MATFMLPEAKNTIHVSTNAGTRARVAAAAPTPTVEGTHKSAHARWWYIVVAYVLVIGAAVLGWRLDVWVHPSAPIAVQGLGVFTALYVAAQAIERTIEPITEWTGVMLGGVNAPKKDQEGKLEDPATDQAGNVTTVPTERVWSKAEVKYRRSIAIKDARSAHDQTSLKKKADVAAASQAAVEQDRRNSTVLVWGIATFLGIVLSGGVGLSLLHSVGAQGTPRVLDIIVTGLAIGGGTKPLHDLISNLQASKDEKKDPAEMKPA
jgi:hypothetical protein